MKCLLHHIDELCWVLRLNDDGYPSLASGLHACPAQQNTSFAAITGCLRSYAERGNDLNKKLKDTLIKILLLRLAWLLGAGFHHHRRTVNQISRCNKKIPISPP